MISLHNLQPAPGAIKPKKRVGRGQGSGKGGTSTRGHKGAQSRSGYSRPYTREGGQNPLARRTPKYGKCNHIKKEVIPMNLDALERIAEKFKLTDVTPAELYKHGQIKKNAVYKVLGAGKLTKALNITAHAFSKSAKEAIEAAKGKAITL